jgi:hypothetical protein
VALALDADRDQAHACPGIEPAVKGPQLGCARLELEEAECGAERNQTAVRHLFSHTKPTTHRWGEPLASHGERVCQDRPT